MTIHSTAIISEEVQLGKDVVVGPYTIIKGQAKIGAGTIIENGVTIGSDHGIVEIGEQNHIYAGAAIGGPPQDKKYNNDNTRLVIGDKNQIREFATLNIGTVPGGGTTNVGNGNLIMAYAHVGHDCFLGNNSVLANNCQLAGHVHIGNNVTVGGSCGISQFVKIGNFAFIAGFSAVNKDILPYCIAQGNYATVRAANKIGLERAGFTAAQVEAIYKAIRILSKGSDTIEARIARIIEECGRTAEIDNIIEFIRSSKRGLAI